MPNIAMHINSGGVFGASRSVNRIAHGAWDQDGGYERLYGFSDFGSNGTGAGPILWGDAYTTRRFGHRFPDQDQSGRTFPPNLSGKYVKIAIEGSYSAWGARLDVEFKVLEYNRRRGLVPLYEFEDLINMNTSFVGGVTVQGYAQEYSLRYRSSRFEFRKLMKNLEPHRS